MPIKFGKSAFRRKSSGNILETIENPPAVSSFRVLKREDVNTQSIEKASELKPKLGFRSVSASFGHRGGARSLDVASTLDEGLVTLSEQVSARESNTTSRRTNHSVSTTGDSSIHYSNDSTQPSSIASASQDDLSLHDRPAPGLRSRSSMDQLKSALNGGKTCPFRLKQQRSTDALSLSGNPSMPFRADSLIAPVPEPPKATIPASRRVEDDLDDNIFEGMPLRNYFVDADDLGLPSPPPVARMVCPILSYVYYGCNLISFQASDPNLLSASPYRPRSRSPSPLPIREVEEAEPCLQRTRSWETDASQTGFLARSHSPISSPHDAQAPLLRNERPAQTMTEEHDVVLDALFASEMLEERHGTPVPRPRSTGQVVETPPPLTGTNPTGMLEVSSYARPTSRTRQPPSSFRPTSSYNLAVNERVPSPSNRLSRLLPADQKVMTPAEFKQYRERQERAHKDDVKMITEEDEPSYEDEDDEVERKQQLARQRKKQEAHLSVWRQQMRKVTGDLPERPRIEVSQSTPDLFATLGTSSNIDTTAGSDDDEDIPLGVLQAHGFPNGNRPPAKTSSTPNLPGLASYPAPAGTTRNDPAAGGGGSGTLPPFARGLPADPFIGANLVTQSNRRSLSFGNAVQPQVQQRQTSPVRMPMFAPQGGLIGMIEEEERAKEMRRKSSNMLSFQGMMPSPGYPQPGMPQGLPGYNPAMNASMMSLQQSMPMQQSMSMPGLYNNMDQAQSQMMMMQQMQWMQQQMMQMQGMASPLPNHPLDLLQGQQSGFFASRPQSVVLDNMAGPSQTRPTHSRNPSSNSAASPQLGRTTPNSINMLGGSLQAQRRPTPTIYAPSIAPSERSNIGQPSRYRPVSTYNLPTTSTTPSAFNNNPITQRQSRMYNTPAASSSHLSVVDPNRIITKQDKGKQPAFKRKVAKAQEDDEDEEEGWAELKKKTLERKEKWRVSRNLNKLMPGLPPVGGAGDENVVAGDSEMGDAQKTGQEQGQGLPEGAYAFVA